MSSITKCDTCDKVIGLLDISYSVTVREMSDSGFGVYVKSLSGDYCSVSCILQKFVNVIGGSMGKGDELATIVDRGRVC